MTKKEIRSHLQLFFFIFFFWGVTKVFICGKNWSNDSEKRGKKRRETYCERDVC